MLNVGFYVLAAIPAILKISLALPTRIEECIRFADYYLIRSTLNTKYD